MKKIKVLSLCDGMSCGRIVLERLGIPVDTYYASEIKDYAIDLVKERWPETVQLGDLTKIHYKDGIIYSENGEFEAGEIDLVIFGSPCQSFSIACRTDSRVGLEDKTRSGLFFECNRIRKEVNPRWFLVENVASMRNDDRDFLTQELDGVKPIKINSERITAGLRNRLYWTNAWGDQEIPQPEKRDIELKDILESGYSDRTKARCLMRRNPSKGRNNFRLFHRYTSTGFLTLIFENEEHLKACMDFYNQKKMDYINKQKERGIEVKLKRNRGYDISTFDPEKEEIPEYFDKIRLLTTRERERLQTVPEGYTSILPDLKAWDLLGDGWTIDVICHLLSPIKEQLENE